MANIPKFSEEELKRSRKLDFDLQKVYDTPLIDTIIFSFANFDKCRKQIIKYEEARKTISIGQKHPKEYKNEALEVLRCQAKNMKFEPVCLDAFNDARECLFRLEGQMRLCQNELHLFEECHHDPVKFNKFLSYSTKVQKEPKTFFASIIRKDYFN